MDKKQIIMLMFSLVVVSSLVYLYFSFNNLIDDYNDLVDDNRDLDEKYLSKIYEVQNLKVLIKDYRENISELINERDNQKSQIGMLTTEIKQKEREYDVLYEEYYKFKNFTWTGCSDSRTVIKFCKGCDWDLSCDTSSMSPTFTCENSLYFCSAKKSEINIGDIIAFLSPEYKNDNYETFYTIHRVIEITDKGYITKGDNNLEMDSFEVPFKNIVGKLWRIDG